jgi:hypothetical protein
MLATLADATAAALLAFAGRERAANVAANVPGAVVVQAKRRSVVGPT